MLYTPLNSRHRAAGAKMASFAGWDMPIQYAGIIQEHMHTRSQASVFDICHMGEFLVSGAGATRGLALAPDHINLLNSLGVCQGRLGRAREALATFRNAFSKDASSLAMMFRKSSRFLICSFRSLNIFSLALILLSTAEINRILIKQI